MVIVGGQLERPDKSFCNIRSKTLEELSGLDFVFNERENQSHSPLKQKKILGFDASEKLCTFLLERENSI